MLGNLWIYVAAAYTKPDPILNTHKAFHCANEILRLGGIPIIPHLTLLWHFKSEK